MLVAVNMPSQSLLLWSLLWLTSFLVNVIFSVVVVVIVVVVVVIDLRCQKVFYFLYLPRTSIFDFSCTLLQGNVERSNLVSLRCQCANYVFIVSEPIFSFRIHPFGFLLFFVFHVLVSS